MTEPAAPDEPRGRTRISTRAITRVVSAVAATTLGVRADQVTVSVKDTAGALNVTLRVALRGPTADRAAPDADWTERVQHEILRTAADLTGVEIAGVTVRLTGAGILSPGRPD